MTFWRPGRRVRPELARSECGFGPGAFGRMAEQIKAALAAADDRQTPVVASITVRLDPATDPLAHVQAVKPSAGVWTAFVQPARDNFMLATFGSAAKITASGAGRFDTLVERAGAVLEAAVVDDLFDDQNAPPGTGVLWVGGFGFYDSTCESDVWREFAPLQFNLPRASIVRRGGSEPEARVTLNVRVAPGASAGQLVGEVEELVDALRLEDVLEVPASNIADAGKAEAALSSTALPQDFEAAVAQGAAEIRAGDYEKIVLAREVEIRSQQKFDPFAVVRGLAGSFPDCTTFAVSEFETTFVGASPELLIRREGRRASTMALAGSIPRGTDPDTDARLGAQLLTSQKNRTEHEIVVRRIERALGRYSAWVSVGTSPELVKVKNIQHLATPIRAQLTEPKPVVELAAALHPTPAVGGEPWDVVSERIRELESFERGWYAGGIGWMDQFEDGEFHVALRSSLIDGSSARLFAGCGIVGDSEPEAELAETETKLDALLPILRRN